MSNLEDSCERIELLETIQRKRNELIHIANKYGILNIETIRCSQELDKLLNIYMKILK